MADIPEQESGAAETAQIDDGVTERECPPWWVGADGLVGVGYRLHVLAIVGLPVELKWPEYERALDRLAFWAATGEWPQPPEGPKKPDLRPIPGGKG